MCGTQGNFLLLLPHWEQTYRYAPTLACEGYASRGFRNLMTRVWVKPPAKPPRPAQVLARGEKYLGGTVGEREERPSRDPEF